MNGDYSSLSNTLGDLRLTNPDQSSSPAPLTPYYHNANTQSPTANSRSTAYENVIEDTPYEYSSSSLSGSNAGLDVHALGFDPTAYTAAPYSSDPPTMQHPQSSTSYEQPEGLYPPSIPRHPSRSHPHSSSRPTSAIYNHSNLSSSSSAVSSSTYSRMRAESGQSGQSNSSGMRRSNSKAQTPSGGGLAPARDQSGVPYRQPSTSNPFARGWPPRQASRLAPGEQDQMYDASSARQPSYSEDQVPLPASSEEWKEKGAAVRVQHGVDDKGNKTTKTVKKGVKDFSFGRTLGEGSYSTVLAATDRQTQREYAIKVLDKQHIIKEKKVKYVNIEKDTLNRLTDHPGVIKLTYTFQDERSLYFVLDLAAGGELLGVLKKTTSFNEECTRFYGAQLLDTIEYMHSRGIIHRDLKPENLLLDDHGHIKVTDFGTAKILELNAKASQFGSVSVGHNTDGAETDRAVSFVGTAEYVSPELLTDKNACKASDLWAFGCIMYQLLAGRPPFKAANEYQTFQKIVNLEYAFPDGFPAVARDLITRLLVLDPAERLSVEGIKRHLFFEGVQWGKGLWKQRAPKLRPYNPQTQEANMTDRSRTDQQAQSTSTSLPKQPTTKSLPPVSTSTTPVSLPSRPKARIITELAPPTQLDIDWSPVLTRANERILKLGQFVVHSAPAPYSPTSKSSNEPLAEQPSKFSRFFGGSTTKKRQRLVMVTSGGRLILAPAGGEKKEAKGVVDLADADVSWRSQVDSKGYTMWCVFTRDKHLTFEDPKANNGDPGFSTRSTQEWLDFLEDVKEHALSQRLALSNTYTGGVDSMNGLSSPTTTGADSSGAQSDSITMGSISSHHNHGRNMPHKDPKGGDVVAGDAAKEAKSGRNRFSKRHSKNGLAAVF